MHDIRAIRADPAAFDAAMARRGLPPVAAGLMALDTDRRAAQTALQEKQARRNALAKEIGQGKRTGADTAALETEATTLRGDMDSLEKHVPTLDAGIRRLLETLPNVLDSSVPDGP
jgi:seryl-tRNA synthetase